MACSKDSRYETKISLLFDSGPNAVDPYAIPKEQWIDDPMKWPSLEFPQIYTYLIDFPGLFTKEKLKAYKSLKAYNYYISGWVHTVWLFPISGTNNCILKAKVRPSQRMNDKPHEAWVGLKKDTGDIINAHCSCMAGLGETCSHVAALLFKVEAFHRLELGKASCTSLPCVWNQAFTKQTKPSRAHNITFIKPKHGKSEATLAEERRIVNRRSLESDIPKVGKKNLLDALHTCMANSAVFSVVDGYVEDTAINDFIADEHDVNLPKQLFDLYQHCHNELPESRLSELVDTTFSKLKVTQMECEFLEKSTRNQSASYIWHEYRRGLITSSHFHSVLHHTGRMYPKSIVNALMQYTRPNPNIPSLKWGRLHEDVARKEYITYMKSNMHVNFAVQSSGLVIHPSYPFIGASPDGLIECQCCGEGLLEIKCPFKYKDVSPISIEALNDRNYFLERDTTGTIHLSSSHAYYHQVQGQMMVKQLPFCDFVCWTTKGLFVDRIYQEKDYMDKYVPLLKGFFLKYVLPEVLTHQHDPNLVVSSTSTCGGSTDSTTAAANTDTNPSTATTLANSDTSSVSVDSTNTSSNKLYCICQKESGGRMIGCDNPSCDIEWFHYTCVGIKRAPKGKWFCPNCIILSM